MAQLASGAHSPSRAEAERSIKNDKPFLQRYLPFWLAVLVDRGRRELPFSADYVGATMTLVTKACIESPMVSSTRVKVVEEFHSSPMLPGAFGVHASDSALSARVR